MNVDILDITNKKVGDAEMAAAAFEAEIKQNLMHEVVLSQLASRRRGTHKTKGRSEVRGGGAKPWKQKGTGRARAGSIRSPLFRGGGTIFGPTPRDYSYSPPKKVRKQALTSALSHKAGTEAITVVDSFSFDAPKTSQAVEVLKALELTGKKVLIVIEAKDSNIEKSFRNIPKVNLVRAEGINVYDLLHCDQLVLTSAALGSINERLG